MGFMSSNIHAANELGPDGFLCAWTSQIHIVIVLQDPPCTSGYLLGGSGGLSK